MRKRILEYLRCPACSAPAWNCEAFEMTQDEVLTGRIICRSCGSWYPIVDAIAVVSTNLLLIKDGKDQLRSDWGHTYRFAADPLGDVIPPSNIAKLQQVQIEHYNKEARRYDREVSDSVFWRAVSALTVEQWGKESLFRNGITLEIGCGTGASTVQLAKQGCRVVAMDISLEAVKLARAKIQRLGSGEYVDFLVSEAESLPFSDGVFQSSIFTGVLHHVTSPEAVLKEISRTLCPAGVVCGYENNASAFRFLFDFLMKFKQLWHEEAGVHPMMLAKTFRKWGRQAGLDVTARSSVFLPPHFLNLFCLSIAKWLLAATDRFFGWIPWLKNQGGLLIISGVRAYDPVERD